MAYATLSHVRARLPARSITPQSQPDTDSVVMFLDEIAGEIDMVLIDEGYSAPVSTTAASSVRVILQSVNAVGAAYKTEWAAPVSDKRGEYEDMYQSAIKMLRTTRLDLPKGGGDTMSARQNALSAGASAFFTRDMVL